MLFRSYFQLCLAHGAFAVALARAAGLLVLRGIRAIDGFETAAGARTIKSRTAFAWDSRSLSRAVNSSFLASTSLWASFNASHAAENLVAVTSPILKSVLFVQTLQIFPPACCNFVICNLVLMVSVWRTVLSIQALKNPARRSMFFGVAPNHLGPLQFNYRPGPIFLESIEMMFRRPVSF